MNGVSAAIVNFGTPELTRRAVWSLRSLYPDLEIRVLDNASPDDSVAQLEQLGPAVPPFGLVESAVNLHHGGGMDRLIRTAIDEWILLFDSDCLAYRRGFIEQMRERAEAENAYMIGQLLTVDAHGYPPTEGASVTYAYVHPHCALVRRSTYLTLPPFEKHGVPCLRNELEAARRGEVLLDFPVRDYVFHLSRGTVNEHGYRLGLKGQLYELRHRIRRLIRRR